ncbi:hypothetical protein S245_011998 [Arachis hypogaea]
MDNKLKLPLLVLLLNCFLFLALSQTASNDDVEALNSLKDSLQINIPSWVGSDPCSGSWEGITCKNSRVVSISLPNTGLKGQLSQNIGSFSELDTLDLSYNKDLTGPLPAEIGNLKKLTKLSLVGCGFNGQIPDEIGSLPQLVFLDLSSNAFDSTDFPQWLLTMKNLTTLRMQEANLSGQIPAGFFSLPSLQYVVLSENQLNGTLNLGPNYSKKLQLIDLHSNSIGDFTQQNQPPSFTIVLESNPICYETGTTESFCKPLQISDENPQNKCPASGVYAFRQKLRAERAISRNNPFGNWDPSKSNCGTPELKAVKQFSFKELKKCTNNFSPANDVGSGGYGKVYKGTLPSGQLIAIKRAQKESKQGGLEFKAEIELLSRVHHKNVVSLVGFCFEEGEQMLVYEFVPNGTLKDTITGKSGIRFGWHRRIKVALGAARGLAYLHEHADPPIIHRDIKSNNILLDEKLDAKVADFGLSKPILDYDKDHVTTQVKGTMGYLDPEYYISQQVTEKSDVYSFGVLMLELITGRKPIDRGKYIVKVVRNSIDKTKDMYGLHELIDRAIRDGSALNGFEKFVDLAMMCLEESGADRPPMSDVVKEIEIILHSIGLDPAADQSEPSTSSSFQHNEVSLESSHQPYSSESLYSSSEYIQKHHEHEPR